MAREHVYDRPSGLNPKGKELGKFNVKQIPDSVQELKTKDAKEVQKYLIFGIIVYMLCC